MSPLIKKEVRLLLPAWIAAILVVAGVPNLLQLISPDLVYNPEIVYLWFTFGAVFLSVASFGQEMSFRTFAAELALPVSRHRIWWLKVGVLLIAFLSVFLVLFVCYQVAAIRHPVYRISFPFGPTLLCFAIIFTGGLWTTLLLRQVVGAFWFTLLTPLLVLVPVAWLSNRFNWSVWVGVGALLVYSAAGFLFARRLFLTAQDRQWTGGIVQFPWRGRKGGRVGALFFGGIRNRYLALAWKEIQLHEVNLLFGAVLLLLNVAGLLVHAHAANPNLRMIAEFMPVLWLLLPLLAGSLAVAEERRLGMIESQLCLPVSRRAQFIIKFAVAFGLALVFLTLLFALNWELLDAARQFPRPILYVSLTLFYVSFYASSMSRSTIQALGGAALLAVFALAAMGLIRSLPASPLLSVSNYEMFGLLVLTLILAVLVFPLVLAGLMFWNFKWLHAESRMWKRNFAVMFATLVMLYSVSGVIYFRSWELFQTTESPHGAARLTAENPPRLYYGGGGLCGILPDGRLWNQTVVYSYSSVRMMRPGRAQFIGPSDWMEIAVDYGAVLGLRSNGTLWVVYDTITNGSFGNPVLKQIDSSTHWKRVAGRVGSDGFLLLKNDGTLWIWGTNNASHWEEKLANDLAVPPVQIGSGTDWVEIASSPLSATERNGRIWILENTGNLAGRIMHLVSITNSPGRDNRVYSIGCAAEVKTNGELWFYWGPPPQWNWIHEEPPPFRGRFQIGTGYQWKAVTFAGMVGWVIALREDGTLWKFRVPSNPEAMDLSHRPIRAEQLGRQSDWIALPRNGNWSGIALAADGGVWVWGEMSRHIWLAPSRRPIYLGNVFEGGNMPE